MTERGDVHRAGTVLLACDAPTRTTALRTALRRDGYAVVALRARAAAGLPVDVALLDYSQDIDAGLRLLASLRREEPRLPLVFVGPVETHVRAAAQQHGAVLFYAPVDTDVLLAAVDRCASRGA